MEAERARAKDEQGPRRRFEGVVALSESGRERDRTRVVREAAPAPGEAGDLERILAEVYHALQEKGYDPVRQLAFYLLTGEPAYITAHRGARSLVTKLERDEVLQFLLRFYLSRRSPAE
ncbi:MAG: IreB family regulatory phosphoprotein [Clostridia bacterium]|nr:IreB family regulatory phosphoprotein [Clostridia bacterium]MCL6521797.1 IreB family regulatory phosphoprotein [Bacillota bacterium]